MDTSMVLMVTGFWLMPNTHEPSQGAGHTRPAGGGEGGGRRGGGAAAGGLDAAADEGPPSARLQMRCRRLAGGATKRCFRLGGGGGRCCRRWLMSERTAE